MDQVDLDSYGTPNDIGPDEPAPRAPAGDPDVTTADFRVWLFDADESETVPDAYVVARRPHPLDFRMWVFVGRGDRAEFVLRASHKYGPGEVVGDAADDCCEVLFAGESLRASHCPTAVEDLVAEVTGGTVRTAQGPEDGGDSPVNY